MASLRAACALGGRGAARAPRDTQQAARASRVRALRACAMAAGVVSSCDSINAKPAMAKRFSVVAGAGVSPGTTSTDDRNVSNGSGGSSIETAVFGLG